MELEILGPNEVKDEPSFVVHAANCADLGKRRYARADRFAETFSSIREIVETEYCHHIEESPGSTWRDYLSEFHVFPCVRLPDEC